MVRMSREREAREYEYDTRERASRDRDGYERSEREPRSRRSRSQRDSSSRSSRSETTRSERKSRKRSERSSRSENQELRFYLQRSSPVVDAPSIGSRMAERLEAVGIETVDDLITADPESLAAEMDHSRITADLITCHLYTSPSPRDLSTSRMPSSA